MEKDTRSYEEKYNDLRKELDEARKEERLMNMWNGFHDRVRALERKDEEFLDVFRKVSNYLTNVFWMSLVALLAAVASLVIVVLK